MHAGLPYPADAEWVAGLVAKVVRLIAVAAHILRKAIIARDTGVRHRGMLDAVAGDGRVENHRLYSSTLGTDSQRRAMMAVGTRCAPGQPMPQ